MSSKGHKRPSPKRLPLKFEGLRNHSAMVERLRKSLYYGKIKNPDSIDYPSLPLTEVTVKMLESVSVGNEGLEVFDMYFASSCIRKASISPCSIMMAMIYLERLKRTNPDYLRTISPCDLFLVSVMIASKFLFDDGEENEVYNDDWAHSGDIDVKKLNRLEREFLSALDWSCYVNPDTFLKQLSKVEALISYNQCRKRNWSELTYSDLLSLLNNPNNQETIQQFLSSSFDCFLKITIISILTYAAAIMTLLGASTLIALSSPRLTALYRGTSVHTTSANISFADISSNLGKNALPNQIKPNLTHSNANLPIIIRNRKTYSSHEGYSDLQTSSSHLPRLVKDQAFHYFFKCRVS